MANWKRSTHGDHIVTAILDDVINTSQCNWPKFWRKYVRCFCVGPMHRSIKRMCYHLEGDFFLWKIQKNLRSIFFFRTQNIYFSKRRPKLVHFCKENKEREKWGSCRIISVLTDWCITGGSKFVSKFVSQRKFVPCCAFTLTMVPCISL